MAAYQLKQVTVKHSVRVMGFCDISLCSVRQNMRGNGLIDSAVSTECKYVEISVTFFQNVDISPNLYLDL